MIIQVFGTWQPHGSLEGVCQRERLAFAAMHCVPADSTHGGEIWHHHFPEVVQEITGGWETLRIPFAAKQLIAKIHEQAVFENLYVRIDRDRPHEAVFFGEVKGYAFLLLRWGLELPSFEVLKGQMYPEYTKVQSAFGLLLVVCVAAAGGVFSALTALIILYSGYQVNPWRAGLYAAIFTGVGIFLLWRTGLRESQRILKEAALPAPTRELQV